MPPYIHWREYLQVMRQLWRPGPPDWPNPNVALVGTAGSGKTTFARELLDLREYVCVIGTKPQDASLYSPLEAKGYVSVTEWSPEETRQPKVIFRPPLSAPTPEALDRQREAIRTALLQAYRTGGWTLYFDEIRYLSETLKLSTELDLLWLQGRSLGLTILASTQRPRSVPVNMWEQSRFLVTFRISGAEDRRTLAAYTGPSQGVVFEVAAALPAHEALFVDSETDVLLRTRVERAPARPAREQAPVRTAA